MASEQRQTSPRIWSSYPAVLRSFGKCSPCVRAYQNLCGRAAGEMSYRPQVGHRGTGPKDGSAPEPVVFDNTPGRGLLHELGAVEFHQVLPPSVECVNLIPFPRPKSRHVR